jgi:hypothetical protein
MGDVDYIYIGPPETCDICNNEEPLMSIIFDGRQFICFYCSIREETKEYNKEKP